MNLKPKDLKRSIFRSRKPFTRKMLLSPDTFSKFRNGLLLNSANVNKLQNKLNMPSDLLSMEIQFSEILLLSKNTIDHLPIRKKGLRRARPIPTALVTVGNPGNPLHFSETSKPC